MGLSASQSRLLTLTARLSNLEFKSQQIQEAKIRLSEKSSEASKKYMDALDAQSLKFNYYSTGSVDATVTSITESGMYRVADALGNYYTQATQDLAQSQTITTDKGNIIKASSDGSVTIMSKDYSSSTWVNNGKVSTTLNGASVSADSTGKMVLSSSKNGVTTQVTSTQTNKVENYGANWTKNVTSGNGGTYVIGSTETTRSINKNSKTFKYSVTCDNEIILKNGTKIEKTDEGYKVTTSKGSTTGNYCTINSTTGNISATMTASGETKTTTTPPTNGSTTINLPSTGNDATKFDENGIRITFSGGKLTVEEPYDGSAETPIKYELSSNSMSMSIGDDSVSAETIPAYNTAKTQVTAEGVTYGITYDGSITQTTQSTTSANGTTVNGTSVSFASNGTSMTTRDANGNTVVSTKTASTTTLADGTSFSVKVENGIVKVTEDGKTYEIDTNKENQVKATLPDGTSSKSETITQGSWVVGSASKNVYYTTDNSKLNDSKWLFEQLKLANLFIQKYDTETESWVDYSYTASSIFTTEDDDTNIAKAEAEYEFEMAEVQTKDKRFDLELDAITTEHEAIKNEREAIDTVIKDNVQTTFKIFS